MGALALLAALLGSSMPATAMTDAASHDPRNLTWIVPRVLAVGGGGLTASDLAYLKSQGFGAVADFRGGHDDGAGNVRAAGMDYLYLPEADASTITESDLERFVAWAQQEEAAGKPMYVHCSNGWHRAPTFAIAYLMATQHVSFDDAAKRVKDAREGVLIRAPGPLLAYQAKLAGQPGLLVTLAPDDPHLAPGGSRELLVHVGADGAPVANARVHVWTEERALDAILTTDAKGDARVTLHAPSDASMLHLFARASSPGYVDGAANPDVFLDGSAGVPTRALVIAAGGVLVVVSASLVGWRVTRKTRARG